MAVLAARGRWVAHPSRNEHGSGMQMSGPHILALLRAGYRIVPDAEMDEGQRRQCGGVDMLVEVEDAHRLTGHEGPARFALAFEVLD